MLKISNQILATLALAPIEIIENETRCSEFLKEEFQSGRLNILENGLIEDTCCEVYYLIFQNKPKSLVGLILTKDNEILGKVEKKC